MPTPPKADQADKDLNSQSNRPRASPSIAGAQPNVLHRTLTGRIKPSRSASSLLSIRNRRNLVSDSARDRIWQYHRAVPDSEAPLPLSEYSSPQSLAVLPSLTAAATESNLFSLEATVHFEEASVLVGEATSLGQFGERRGRSSLTEFMIPTQNQPDEQSFGHSSSTYPISSYIDQYSIAESHQAMAPKKSQEQPVDSTDTGYIDQCSDEESHEAMEQTSSHGYAASYATSPTLSGSPLIAPPGELPEYDAQPNYQYSSAIRSPSYHGDTSPPQPPLSYTTAQGHPYVPAYSAPSEYTHTHYAPSYAGYPSSYQQPHTPGAMAPQQHYGSAYSQSSPSYGDGTGVRVVNEPSKNLQCWDHGCQGKKFSTFSNLLRHQKEKAGLITKTRCERCGVEFTRPSARNGHMVHNKCKNKCKRRGIGSSSS